MLETVVPGSVVRSGNHCKMTTRARISCIFEGLTMRLPSPRTVSAGLGVAATGWALLSLRSWTSDDAFISFRYARNLVEGHGLVFNVGERVEAYTNFLWTLWASAGLALGFPAERWTAFWGATAWIATIALLLFWSLRRRSGGPARWLPLAAIAAALQTDAARFATSGLETPLFTLLLLGGFLLTTNRASSVPRIACAGVLFGLAALTRPDGLLPAALAGGWILAFRQDRLRAGPAFAIGFAILWATHLGWRISYYGDPLPNTYYAKSAWLSWYSQGWHYTQLYFSRYWPLLVGPLLCIVAIVFRRSSDGRDPLADGDRDEDWPALGLALAIAIGFTFYVVRVGGDFMFARFLLPVAPFYFIVLEVGWDRAFRPYPRPAFLVALVLAAGMVATPSPVGAASWSRGIADEFAYYHGSRSAKLEAKARLIGRIFEDVPVRVAFYGDEARIVYRADLDVAFECHAGLTEPEVARQPLDQRGRPGHEKHASALHVLETRRADITFSGVPQRLISLREYIPEVIVHLDDEFTAQLLRWNPVVVEALVRGGAQVPDVPRMLDAYLTNIEQLPDDRVAADWVRFRRFYFDVVSDPARERPFRERLGIPQ